jgi:hypothetical protein
MSSTASSFDAAATDALTPRSESRLAEVLVPHALSSAVRGSHRARLKSRFKRQPRVLLC